MALFPFTSNSWDFKHDMMLWLREQILPPDRNEFGVGNIEYTDIREFFFSAASRGSFYLLKEPEDRTQARIHYRR
jgi:hypothetical protein